MTIRIGINGLGRIGRLAFQTVMTRYPATLKIVGINDINPAAALVPILRRDSVYGPSMVPVAAGRSGFGEAIIADGRAIPLHHAGTYAAKIIHSPFETLFWKDVGADVVLECAGGGPDGDKAQEHIWAGAKRVIISAPASNVDATLVMGVNEGDYNPKEHRIISMASCTTNCVGPILKVLDRAFGIESAYLTSVTSYTNSQRLVDAPHSDPRRARAAALNIIPTESSTGDSIGRILPQLKGRYEAMAFRVPVPCGAVSHIRLRLTLSANKSEVNQILAQAAKERPQLLEYSEEPLVSADIVGNERSAIVDGLLTQAEGSEVTVVAWYDNELAYACRLADLAAYIGERSGQSD